MSYFGERCSLGLGKPSIHPLKNSKTLREKYPSPSIIQREHPPHLDLRPGADARSSRGRQ